MRIEIAVIEDEAVYQEQMRRDLRRFEETGGHNVHVDFYWDAKAFEAAGKRYHIMLIDIFLGRDEDGGLRLAQRLRAAGNQCLILFVTNMVQYAIYGYSVEAFHFLVKPVEYEVLAQKLQRAIQILKERNHWRLCIPTKSGMECVSVPDICYMESHRRGIYICTCTSDQIITSSQSLKAMEEQLDSRKFYRCHSAFLVNLMFVDRVRNDSALVNGKEIPVSRHRKKDFMEALANCLGGAIGV